MLQSHTVQQLSKQRPPLLSTSHKPGRLKKPMIHNAHFPFLWFYQNHSHFTPSPHPKDPASVSCLIQSLPATAPSLPRSSSSGSTSSPRTPQHPKPSPQMHEQWTKNASKQHPSNYPQQDHTTHQHSHSVALKKWSFHTPSTQKHQYTN